MSLKSEREARLRLATIRAERARFVQSSRKPRAAFSSTRPRSRCAAAIASSPMTASSATRTNNTS